MSDKTKRIETIFELNIAPESKNVLWLDNSKENLVLKRYINGSWRALTKDSIEINIGDIVFESSRFIKTIQLDNNLWEEIHNNKTPISLKGIVKQTTTIEGLSVEITNEVYIKFELALKVISIVPNVEYIMEQESIMFFGFSMYIGEIITIPSTKSLYIYITPMG